MFGEDVALQDRVLKLSGERVSALELTRALGGKNFAVARDILRRENFWFDGSLLGERRRRAEQKGGEDQALANVGPRC